MSSPVAESVAAPLRVATAVFGTTTDLWSGGAAPARSSAHVRKTHARAADVCDIDVAHAGT